MVPRLWLLIAVASIVLPAHAANSSQQEVQEHIAGGFAIAGEDGYSTAAVRAAVAHFLAMEHPATRTAAALLLQLEGGSTDEVRRHLDVLGREAQTLTAEKYPDLEIDVSDYDGSAISLMDNLIEVQGVGYYDIGWKGRRPYFVIPCTYFQRRPSVGRLTRPWYLGRWPDATFPIACTDEVFKKEIPAVLEFWAAGQKVTVDSTGCGTMYRDNAAFLRRTRNKVLYRPHDALADARMPPGAMLRQSNLFGWALMGRSNYRTFLELEKLYRRAFAQMETRYVRRFGLTIEEARAIVPSALLSQLLHAGYGDSFSRAMTASLRGEREFRRIILGRYGISARSIPPFNALEPLGIDSPATSESEFPFDTYPMAGWPEPLLHLATNNAHTLKIMIEKGYDIEVRDALGKTTLMAAAQDDESASVDFLIAQGADVNAVSLPPEDIPYNYVFRKPGCETPYNVKVGSRTALMYALSEASEYTIRPLLRAGADLRAVDSAGNSIADYVRGKGPLGTNPKLPDDFRDWLIAKINAQTGDDGEQK